MLVSFLGFPSIQEGLEQEYKSQEFQDRLSNAKRKEIKKSTKAFQY